MNVFHTYMSNYLNYSQLTLTLMNLLNTAQPLQQIFSKTKKNLHNHQFLVSDANISELIANQHNSHWTGVTDRARPVILGTINPDSFRRSREAPTFVF